MKKVFLILLLCSPLGWVAWEESRSLLNDFTEPVVIDSADDDPPDGEKPANAPAPGSIRIWPLAGLLPAQ